MISRDAIALSPAANPVDLDELAWPVHRKPYDRYLGLPIVNLLGSRGCTHGCAFCSIASSSMALSTGTDSSHT